MMHIDGTAPDGSLDGSAKAGPYAIFDDKRQDWVQTGIHTRLGARIALARHTKAQGS